MADSWSMPTHGRRRGKKRKDGAGWLEKQKNQRPPGSRRQERIFERVSLVLNAIKRHYGSWVVSADP